MQFLNDNSTATYVNPDNGLYMSFPSVHFVPLGRTLCSYQTITLAAHSNRKRGLPNNFQYPRCSKLPPEFGVNLFLKKPSTNSESTQEDIDTDEEEDEDTDVVWKSDEIESHKSLFLQTFFWAQNQPHLFPDDWILATTVEVLAKNHELKVPFNINKFTDLASRGVLEAMIKGLLKGGSLRLAWRVLIVARKDKRMLDPSIYAKLTLELGKNPDRYSLVVPLLDELGEQDDLNLNQQDCTAIIKVCAKMGKFEMVESLLSWFKQSGCQPSVVMYTFVIRSRYTEMKYMEAVELVWEMEASNCLFDLPAYRVVIKSFVALNDPSKAMRYFSKLKEAGFSPTYGLYKDMLEIYMASGRIAKCKETLQESRDSRF